VAAFDVSEVVLLSIRGFERHDSLALVLGSLVLLVLLAFELAEHAAAKRDHELSHEIAEWLLPHTPPSLDGVEVAFSNRMANHVGSDYFNVFPRLKEGAEHAHSVFIVSADVAGTGLQGALLMATFQASLRALADTRMPLRALASELNQWCWDRSLEGKHFTMAFLADLDPQSGSLAYVSAGHQSPVVVRGKGEIERLDVAGFPLGAFASSEYEVGRTVLGAEDTLVVFTDGVVNAVNNSQELFSEARIIRVLNDSRGFTANETLNHLAMRVLSFCGSRKQDDDFTFVVVRKLSRGNGTR